MTRQEEKILKQIAGINNLYGSVAKRSLKGEIEPSRAIFMVEELLTLPYFINKY